MVGMDIFNSDPFTAVSLTHAVNEMPYVPGRIGEMGIFRNFGVNTTTVMIEKKGTTLSLIQTSPRGSPPSQRTREKRDLRNLNTAHLTREAVVYADQVQNVRAFGSESELEVVQTVLNQEMGVVNTELDMTLENLRLGAVKGILLDADGATIYNLFTEFGVSQIAEFDFELDDAATDVKKKCAALRRLMAPELKIGNINFGIHAICSDDFFDDLIGHANVKEAWARWNDGQAAREDYTYQTFFHAGILFENYRGSDDGTSVSLTAGKAHFFPTGVPGLFECPFAPADTIQFANTMGLPRYAIPGNDPTGKDKFKSVEIQSNPLPFCTRPRTLIKAKRY